MFAPKSRQSIPSPSLKGCHEAVARRRPERTDGALTVVNLAREAGVSRATANRAGDLLAEFRAAEARQRRSSPRAIKERIHALEAELRAVRGAEMAELRALTRTLAQHIQMLTLQLAERDAVIEGLRAELSRSVDARVVPLRRPPLDGTG